MSERTRTTATTTNNGAAPTAVAASPAAGPAPATPSTTTTNTGPIAADTPAPPVTQPGPALLRDSTPSDSTRPGAPTHDVPAGVHGTKPVTVRPKVRGPRRGPLTRMGPWAPVAGGALGLLAGVVVALLLIGAAADFADRLALVLTVVGLGMLGAAGTLLADEVRMIRQGAREAAVRPAWAEATAPLLRGVTPARLLLLISAFVLFLAAYVTR